jgi:chorismate mutase
MLFEVSQEAMDLNFDGLMIETHCNPDKALSDASQQITPQSLRKLLDSLVLRKANIDNTVISHTLEDYRIQIDKFDDKLLEVLEKRMNVADKIGKYKKQNNITILQSSRWDQLLNKRITDGNKKGLSEDFVMKVFRAIHQESINHQTRIMNE